MSDLSPNITQRGRPSRKAVVGGAAPLKSDPVALGREAWARRKGDTAASWQDWKLIGAALLVGRKEAMEKAAGKCSGRKYNDTFGKWLQDNGLDDIDKSDRAKLLLIMENLAEVEAWRAKLKEGKRGQLNHPSSIWRAWTCKDRGNRGKPSKNGSCVQLSEEDDNYDDEEDEDQAEITWQRNIELRARKSIGAAKIRDRWMLPEPPEDGTIETVRQAADA